VSLLAEVRAWQAKSDAAAAAAATAAMAGGGVQGSGDGATGLGGAGEEGDAPPAGKWKRKRVKADKGADKGQSKSAPLTGEVVAAMFPGAQRCMYQEVTTYLTADVLGCTAAADHACMHPRHRHEMRVA
jgi:hypothetical protein